MGALSDIRELEGVLFTPLKIVEVPLGPVLHGIKESDTAFAGFGEAYFTAVNFGAVKGWKRHYRMTMNLIVLSGEVRFVLFDDRKESPSSGRAAELSLSRRNYGRLTVPPGLWMAFQGMSKEENLLLNFANIAHDPTESESLPLNALSGANFAALQWGTA